MFPHVNKTKAKILKISKKLKIKNLVGFLHEYGKSPREVLQKFQGDLGKFEIKMNLLFVLVLFGLMNCARLI